MEGGGGGGGGVIVFSQYGEECGTEVDTERGVVLLISVSPFTSPSMLVMNLFLLARA